MKLPGHSREVRCTVPVNTVVTRELIQMLPCASDSTRPESCSSGYPHQPEKVVRSTRVDLIRLITSMRMPRAPNPPQVAGLFQPSTRWPAAWAVLLRNQVAEYGQPGKVELRPQEIQLAERLVETWRLRSSLESSTTHLRRRALELIDAEREGQEVRPARPQKLAPVVDLMDALQRWAWPPPGEIHAVEDQPAASPRERALKRRGAA